MLLFINSGKSPGTLHAESESLSASNLEGVTLCFCSCGTKNDGLDGGTGRMCIRVGVICAAHETRGYGCGGGEEGRGEEHEEESEDGGEEEGGLGEHVEFGFLRGDVVVCGSLCVGKRTLRRRLTTGC